MSLEKLVKEFAERVRAELIAQIAAKNDEDTAVVKWQGFDENGKPIVKDLDQIKAVTGVGSAAQKKGSALIYDKTDSVEYGKGKKKKAELVKKLEVPVTLREKRKKINTISRNLLATADLFFPDGAAVPLPIYNIPITAFYMVLYSTLQPSPTYNYTDVVRAGGNSYGNPYPDSVNTSVTVSSYPGEATGGLTYRVAVAAAAVRSGASAGGTGSASASVTGFGLSCSTSCSGVGPGGQENGDTAIDMNIAVSTQGETVQVQAQGYTYFVPNANAALNLGEGAAAFKWAFISFPSAVYYFQMPNDIETNGIQIRQIDLNAIVPNRIFQSRIVHNYVAREGNNAIAYTIYQAIDVDMSQELQDSSTTSLLEKTSTMYFGKVTKYTIHTKLNMLTGEYESKINASPNTGNPNILTGGLIPYDRYGPSTGNDGTWLMYVEASAQSFGPLFASGHQGVNCAITDPRTLMYMKFAENPTITYSFNPEAIWRESYEGDWLHVHKDLPWDNTAASNISGQDIHRFLQLSYRNSFFYDGLDSKFFTGIHPLYGFDSKDTTGSAWEGNTPISNTWQVIQSMYSFTNYNSTYSQWANYFNGSIPNVPNDYSSWRTWTLAQADYSSVNLVNFSTKTATLPNFSLAQNVLESGNVMGDRLSKDKLYFSFVALDSIRLVSYQITNETVTLITASEGYAFSVGDLIQITEDVAINGIYTISQVTSTTQFQIIIPGSSNTVGAVISTAIAAKLPPAS